MILIITYPNNLGQPWHKPAHVRHKEKLQGFTATIIRFSCLNPGYSPRYRREKPEQISPWTWRASPESMTARCLSPPRSRITAQPVSFLQTPPLTYTCKRAGSVWHRPAETNSHVTVLDQMKCLLSAHRRVVSAGVFWWLKRGSADSPLFSLNAAIEDSVDFNVNLQRVDNSVRQHTKLKNWMK